MNILLTNDDGYSSDGIRALAVAARNEGHEVWIFAPDSERSAQSHAMTLRNPLKVRRHADREYSCSGTPADCVILAGHGVLPFKPDIVVSGINRGPNLGTDLIYSGTAAAARQASMIGIPGIAVSLAEFREPFRYRALAATVIERLPELISLWTPELFININAPNAEDDHRYEFVESVPSRRVYMDTLKVFEGPDGHSYCFFTDGRVETEPLEGSDEQAVGRGAASISRIFVYPRSEEASHIARNGATEASR
ncbi:MAG: 5'/3'-nucleotidase SurE [Spirochaetales bacterium]|nr:MAG: 5'/3'-nucleotidase SurE [Spirochaetales bacterium]